MKGILIILRLLYLAMISSILLLHLICNNAQEIELLLKFCFSNLTKSMT